MFLFLLNIIMLKYNEIVAKQHYQIDKAKLFSIYQQWPDELDKYQSRKLALMRIIEFSQEAKCVQLQADKVKKFFIDQAFAKGVCRQCNVKEECIVTALKTEDNWYVRGGLTAAERKSLESEIKRTLKRTNGKK
jgi:hypothetical protein